MIHHNVPDARRDAARCGGSCATAPQVHVKAFEGAQARGESVSKQADPVYTHERRLMSRALRREGSEQSARRAAVLQLNGVAVGRPSEVAALSPDVLVFDSDQGCISAMWAQQKTHKHKLVAIMAGADRHICPLYALATAYTMGCFKRHRYHDEQMNYLFPELATTSKSNPANKQITSWMRALTSSSPNVQYRKFQVDELSSTITSGGQRVGGINEMASNGVSAEFILFNSGHDAESISTLWHYIGVTLPMCMPGALVLHGWRAPAYGPGRAARPPSLEPLLAMAVNETRLGDFVDAVLHLVPSMAPPDFLRRTGDGYGTGQKRAITSMLGAAMIMHYPGSKDGGECPAASAHMESSMVAHGLAPNVNRAGEFLRAWSAHIQVKFDQDNADLSRMGQPYSPRVPPTDRARDLHAEVGPTHARSLTTHSPLTHHSPLTTHRRSLR